MLPCIHLLRCYGIRDMMLMFCGFHVFQLNDLEIKWKPSVVNSKTFSTNDKEKLFITINSTSSLNFVIHKQNKSILALKKDNYLFLLIDHCNSECNS